MCLSHTLSNWLQAFPILANVIGEKAPENCSPLFLLFGRYWGGLQNVWGYGMASFRQCKALWPSLRWDHKDIGLWLKLMAHARAPGQPFLGGASCSGAAGQPATLKGFCYQFVDVPLRCYLPFLT